MKEKYRHRYHRHRHYRRSNLENISNILELALTEVGNRNKTIHKAIIHKASKAYEQLSYYLEIMIAKGLLDMDRTE
jgi:predicted transcriptional regulator